MSATIHQHPRALECRIRQEARDAQHVVENPESYAPETIVRCVGFLTHPRTLKVLGTGL